jgi:hypothetical protein
MYRIILLSCGRTGSLRRKLMTDIFLPDPPKDSATVEVRLHDTGATLEASPVGGTLSAINRNPSDELLRDTRKKTGFLDRWDLAKIRRLISSQKKQQAAAASVQWPRGEITASSPTKVEIPEENAWGRPLPYKVLRTKQRKWWLRIVHKLMAPVGRAEWETLNAIALGLLTKDPLEAPTRRPVARALETRPQEQTSWRWMPYARLPISHLERKKARKYQRMSSSRNDGPYGSTIAPRFSRRILRRLYQNALALTPFTEQNPQTLENKMLWASDQPKIPVASTSQARIFEGV